jgi:hypothetical protein
VTFDRLNNRARVKLSVRGEPHLVPYLIAHASFPLLDEVFLLEGKSPKAFNWAEHCAPILEAIGSPRVATPDGNAATAMGIAPSARRGGAAPETPAARVLWNPPMLERKAVLPAVTAHALAQYVRGKDALNASQELATAHALERGLTLIWGPPGTGKTQTLAAILHAMAAHAAGARQPLRVLVTGPTYKAVEEVMHRAANLLSADTAAPANFFMGYAQGRAPGAVPPGIAAHVSYETMLFDRSDADMLTCLNGLTVGAGVTIAGCSVRQARQFAKYIAHTSLHEVFDVVIIDESSQVPVSHALAALSGLRAESRLIIAGDHLQMPPIAAIEAPADAAYLVGSIQTYLTKRTFGAPVPLCVLERNYRSAEDVVAFARSIGYPPALQAEHGNTRLHYMQSLATQAAYPANLPWCDRYPELLGVDSVVATLLHEDDVSSQGNEYEAKLVAGMVWMLRQSVGAELDGRGTQLPVHRMPSAQEFWADCVGVVTPHRAQRALVVRELEQLFPAEANLIAEAVDTVERFQGGERHTIIVTFGVADVDVIGGEEAFLMQLERMNVAVSRAMAKCIVVMPDALAAHIPEDKRALSTAHALKDYVEEFCNLRVDATFVGPSGTRNGQVRYRA